MHRTVIATALLAMFATTVLADPQGRAGARTSVVFPAVVGTTFTFTSPTFKPPWQTRLATSGGLFQYVPHNDILNYFAKAGFKVAPDGIHIVGETLADLGGPAPMPVRAISFPITKGARATVPGLFPTTFTVGARETIKVPAGNYSAWKITLTDTANPSGAVWIAAGVGVVKIQLPSGRVDELTKIEPPAR